jgi:hypothetical protein
MPLGIEPVEAGKALHVLGAATQIDRDFETDDIRCEDLLARLAELLAERERCR